MNFLGWRHTCFYRKGKVLFCLQCCQCFRIRWWSLLAQQSKGLSEIWKVQIIDKIMTMGQRLCQHEKKRNKTMHNFFFVQESPQNHLFSAFHGFFLLLGANIILLAASIMINKLYQPFYAFLLISPLWPNFELWQNSKSMTDKQGWASK